MFIYYLIDDNCIIDDNVILVRNIYNMLMKIKIINNNLVKEDILFTKDKKIYDFIYIKESRLLVINFKSFIGIWDIDSLLKNPIQIINNKSRYLFKFNSNLFIAYNNKNISIYQKTNNIKLYQLSSILILNNEKNKLNLLKLDNKTIMISEKNDIYLIDIRNMKTKKKYKFINGEDEIKSIYKKDKDIFINNGNYLYTIRYNKSHLEIVNIIKNSQFEIEREIKKYLFCRPYKIRLENENILNCKDPIKFFSYKHELSIGNSIQMFEEKISLPSFEILEEIESSFLMREKDKGYQLVNDIMNIDEDKIENKFEIKNSKNYSKIIHKKNYDKKKDILKKNMKLKIII